MDPQESATPLPEGTGIETAPQVQEDVAPQDTAEGIEEAPQLSDEDYHLNFLGTDKFDLPKEVPEEIRSALKNLEKSLNKGWTEKNMKFADERKQFTAAQQEAVQQVESQRALLKDLAKVEALQDQINQYDQVDWAQWAQTDPEAANRAFMAFQGVQRQHAKLNGDLSQKQEQERQRQQQQASVWLQQSEDRLRQSIKDWSGDKAKTISSFVAETYLNTNTQMDQGALQAVAWHPGLVQMAHEAMLYRDSLKRASAKPAVTPVVPVPKVAGTAPVAKDPDKMSDKEWMAYREAELARKRRPVTNNRR